jgi:protein-tyrosine-phosphatase
MTASRTERRVLFVCTHNAGRTIVAAALLNAHQPPRGPGRLGWTDPSDALNSAGSAGLRAGPAQPTPSPRSQVAA